MRKLTDEKQTAATRRPSGTTSKSGIITEARPSIEHSTVSGLDPSSLSWTDFRRKARQNHGESYFKNRSHKDLIEDFVTVAASEEIRIRQLSQATEENAILLQRIESMKMEIAQLKQLNEAYGVSLDKFFESRSVTCLKRT